MRVLITGVTGQDGAIAAKRYLDLGHSVTGTFRRNSSGTLWRLEELNILSRITLSEWRLEDPIAIREIVLKTQPDVVLHFAAESYPQDSLRQPTVVLSANILGTSNLLESLAASCPEVAVVTASSSEIYGKPTTDFCAFEDAQHLPTNAYGISKAATLQLTRLYREREQARASCAILFNHESSLRSPAFLTRKVTAGMARLRLDRDFPPISLGDMTARRDWGFAEEYVEAMVLMSALEEPQDFIVATGSSRSVRDVVAIAAESAGFSPVFDLMDGREVCVDNDTGRVLTVTCEELKRPEGAGALTGNSSLLRRATGWVPKHQVEHFVPTMVARDLERTRRSPA